VFGFVDIPECRTGKHNCDSEEHCREKDGSFECFCPEGLIGNGTKEGGGCHPKQPADPFIKIVIGNQIINSFQFCLLPVQCVGFLR